MQRNASLIVRNSSKGVVDRTGMEAKGIVRFHRRREGEVFVGVRKLGLTGIALLNGSAHCYGDLSRGDVVNVRYLGCQAHLQQNLFEVIDPETVRPVADSQVG